jgi:hypothetical protein
MTAIKSGFDQLTQKLESGGTPSVLDELIQQLRDAKRFHDLFEALKMKVRSGLNLPLLYSDSGDDLSTGQRDELEEGLIEACREVGLALIGEGHPREGWMYLRPVGDRQAAREALLLLDAEEELLDEMIEVCLHEGVDRERGFSLVLQHHGTCNAITTFESLLYQGGKSDLRGACQLLVKHVHTELKGSLAADIERQSGSPPEESTIGGMVAERDWLFGEHVYHIDTTHLASTVRFARMLDDQETLELALDMTEYGRRLHEQFQYPQEEPFVDLYPASAIYLNAMLGRQLDECKAYFAERAQQVDAAEHGNMTREVYVDLLHRLGDHSAAVQASFDLDLAGTQSLGVAPSLLELCEAAGDYKPLMEFSRNHDNLLAYGMALLNASSSKPASA